MRWWDVDGLPAIEQAIFGPDAWAAEQFWSELAGVPASRWYTVAVEPWASDPSGPTTPCAREATEERGSDPGGPTVPSGRGAGRGGEIVGYTGLAVAGSPGRWAGDVQTMAVRPDRQGRGLGRRLLDALLAEAERRGCGEVFLEVRPDNAAALALYAGRGFAEIAARPRYYADGTDALVLRRRSG